MSEELIPTERIETKILLLRGQKVMLDRDLAVLYGVATRVLNQAVKRNRDRFPSDFMIELSREEIRNISQIVICSATLKHAPKVYAFLMNPPEPPRKSIGFSVRERRVMYRAVARKGVKSL